MFSKEEYLNILRMLYDRVIANPAIYLPVQLPVVGLKDYSWGDLVRCVKRFRGDVEVVRAYEKLRELLSLRLIEEKSLELAIKNRLLEDFLVDTKVIGLGEADSGKEMSVKEMEKRMGELGWVRKASQVGG